MLHADNEAEPRLSVHRCHPFLYYYCWLFNHHDENSHHQLLDSDWGWLRQHPIPTQGTDGQNHTPRSGHAASFVGARISCGRRLQWLASLSVSLLLARSLLARWPVGLGRRGLLHWLKKRMRGSAMPFRGCLGKILASQR